MKKALTDLKTVILEIISLVLSLIWYISDSSWEPLSIFITSAVALIISLIIIFLSINKKISGESEATTQTSNLVSNNRGNNVSGNFITGNGNTISQTIINNKEEDNNPTLKLSPIDIHNSLNEAKPFQRKAVANSYIGHTVNWKLKYFSINIYKGNLATIYMKYPNDWHLVGFDINIEKYPQFKTANENDLFEVYGKIKSCNDIYITLELINLSALSK